MARKNFGAKPYSYPQPVLIIVSYDENGVADAMNAAWGGISETNEISMCISESHKTTKNILAKKAFTISMGDAAHVTACDYVGMESGNKVKNKLEKAGFTVSRSEFVDAPVINELAVCLECRLKSYDSESCRLVGEIVNVSVDEAAMTDGKVDVAKVAPICFDPFNNAYNVLGEKVGNAFSEGSKLK
ncbi:MAG: flavin reductase family protein [Oliverpabstia sp.]